MTDFHRPGLQPREALRADLTADALGFLRQYGLHPAPEAYLAHGYVDLCLKAWPTAGGLPLRLAVRWALWTWTTDDLLDGGLGADAPPDAIERLTHSLRRVGAGSEWPAPYEHPVVHALAELVRQTRAAMPDHWWQRYREQLDTWIVAARDKLMHYLRPGRTPTLREYLLLRLADGGMLLAAMWCELAGQCITPHWTDPVVHDLLDAFSTCGILTNDLAGGTGEGETFNAVAARMADDGLSLEQARREVSERLEAEERRFRWLYSAVRRGFPAEPLPEAEHRHHQLPRPGPGHPPLRPAPRPVPHGPHRVDGHQRPLPGTPPPAPGAPRTSQRPGFPRTPHVEGGGSALSADTVER
ncbi:terpene synthase family protein [Kitasatospora arboriphila]